MRGRAAIRWLIALNVVGVIAAAVFGGAIAPKGPTPWWAFASAAVFLIGAVWPFFVEYRSFNRDFARIESSFLSTVRQPYFPSENKMFPPDDDAAPKLGAPRAPVRTATALCVIAAALLIVDLGRFAMRLPPPGTDIEKITNY